jgi:hypothetical protein
MSGGGDGGGYRRVHAGLPVETGGANGPFIPRGFLARHSQRNCGKGRFSLPHHFWGVKTGPRFRTRGCAHAFRSGKHEKVGRGCEGNPTRVSGGVLRTVRAQNPRFEKSKRGKFEREKFARG